MNDEKTQAEAALRAATEHHSSIRREMLQAITVEQKKIEARYALLLDDAQEAKRACQAEIDRINVALAAANPLIGRKVHQPAKPRTWRDQTGNGEAFGIIEAYMPGDGYSGTRPPAPGEIIIRLLKKNGSRGIGHKNLSYLKPNDLPLGWVYLDIDAAQPKES